MLESVNKWLVVCVLFVPFYTFADPTTDMQSNWVVEPGFVLDVDVSGFDFPAAIALVPHPGPDPESPIYFVAELRGKGALSHSRAGAP